MFAKPSLNNTCAIIVSFNPDTQGLRDLISSISLLKSILVIDNASTLAESVSKVCLTRPNVQFVALSENLGLGAAQNIGIKLAKALDFEYVLFFDQDSLPANDSYIQTLFNCFSEVQDSKSLYCVVGSLCIDKRTSKPYPIMVRGLLGLFKKVTPRINSNYTKVEHLLSSGTLVPIKLFDIIGGVMEEFFIDYLDTEWCIRAVSQGYSLYLSHHSTLIHQIGSDCLNIFDRNIPVDTSLRRFYRLRNLLLMSRLPYISKILILSEISKLLIISTALILYKKTRLPDELDMITKAAKSYASFILNRNTYEARSAK